MRVLILHACLCILALAGPVLAQAPGPGPAVPQGGSPFLVTQGLPHLTMDLKQHWDDPALGLDEAQRARLLEVRKATIGAVREIKERLAPVEQAIREGIGSGMTPEELAGRVATVADLKAKATMVHLRCIHDTLAVLRPEQVETLRALQNNGRGRGRGAGQGPARGRAEK